MDLNTAIDQARQRQNRSWTDLARIIGTTTHTLSNMRYGRTEPRPEHVKALETALGWAEGSYWAVRNGHTPTELATPQTPQTPTISGQMRMVGHTETAHGTLTWIEQAGGLRDYTLARDINGVSRSVGLPGSTLTPAEAAADLAVGLDMLERMMNNKASM